MLYSNKASVSVELIFRSFLGYIINTFAVI